MIDKTFLLYNTISYNSHDNNTVTKTLLNSCKSL